FAGNVVDIRGFRWVEGHVVAAATGRVYAASAHAFDDVFVGHDDFHHEVQGYIGLFQGVCLRNGAGEAIEQIAFFTVGLLTAVADQANNNVVRDETACVHDFFGFDTQWGLRLDSRAQHVARRDLGNTEFFGDERGLRSLASAGGAEQDQSHENLQRYVYKSVL